VDKVDDRGDLAIPEYTDIVFVVHHTWHRWHKTHTTTRSSHRMNRNYTTFLDV